MTFAATTPSVATTSDRRRRTAAAVFHVLAMLHHLFVVWYSVTSMDADKVTDPFVKKAANEFSWRFFSGWTFANQVVFLMLSVTDDSLRRWAPACTAHPLGRRLAAAKSFLFQAWVFPLSGAVTWMFWLLYALDRELVFPEAFDSMIPWWLNHAVHTNVALVIVTELFLGDHPWKERSLTLQALLLYLAAYDSCLLYTRYHDGVWLYPVYEVIPGWLLRLLYFMAGHSMVVGLYFAAESVGRYLNVRRAAAREVLATVSSTKLAAAIAPAAAGVRP